MATDQPLSQLNGLPVIENVLAAAVPVVLGCPTADAPDDSDKWQTIEDRIAGWAPMNGEPDSRTDEDGYRLPARNVIALATQIAVRLREGGVSVPVWVVQDGNGGIDFEWRSGDQTETLSINARGETELMRFESSKLIARKAVAFAPVER